MLDLDKYEKAILNLLQQDASLSVAAKGTNQQIDPFVGSPGNEHLLRCQPGVLDVGIRTESGWQSG